MAGPFKQGYDERRNTKGRPKGKGNKNAEIIREKLSYFLDNKALELAKLWDKLEIEKTRPGAKEKLAFFERLLKHVLPNPLHELERLSEQQLDALIERLKSGHNSN